jgi:uncharacterized membrane protein YhaH (DUF805 family)
MRYKRGRTIGNDIAAHVAGLAMVPMLGAIVLILAVGVVAAAVAARRVLDLLGGM